MRTLLARLIFPSALTNFILSSVLLFTACRQQKPSPSSDEVMLKKLPGIWTCEYKYPSGGDSKSTIRVATDGSCQSTLSIPGRKLGPRSIEQSGTWRVENGFLVGTITNDSQTNAVVPSTNRYRILRLDDRELVLEHLEKVPGVMYPTNQIVFSKQSN
jgi:hypothetical protein